MLAQLHFFWIYFLVNYTLGFFIGFEQYPIVRLLPHSLQLLGLSGSCTSSQLISFLAPLFVSCSVTRGIVLDLLWEVLRAGSKDRSSRCGAFAGFQMDWGFSIWSVLLSTDAQAVLERLAGILMQDIYEQFFLKVMGLFRLKLVGLIDLYGTVNRLLPDYLLGFAQFQVRGEGPVEVCLVVEAELRFFRGSLHRANKLYLPQEIFYYGCQTNVSLPSITKQLQ